MRLLLDTHAFIWWIADSGRLSPTARGLIADESHDIVVSAASAWEIATKYRLVQLAPPTPAAFEIAGVISGQGFLELPISVRDAEHAGRLPGPHRDPFDRMLVAQAVSRGMALVSRDEAFDRYGVNRTW
ncbi:MAG: type II toxin-antitoxin system VapC family toxin [Gemmatimonadota bacterium]|nr:type II toxin-antitoxin system VapC family toxin [Gemmatimonadota bacterium]